MKNPNTTMLAALLCGAAAGAALAVLFAPAKGSELRQKIQDNSGELKTTLSDLAEGIVETLSAKIKSKLS